MSPYEIKELRLKLRLSQRDMAKTIGVSRVCIVHWETGEHEPHPVNLARLQALARGQELEAKRPHPLDDPTVRRIFTDLLGALNYYYRGRSGEAK